jgi:hypothetical protein
MNELRKSNIIHIFEFCGLDLCSVQQPVAFCGKLRAKDGVLPEIMKFLRIFSIYEETVYEQVQKD